MGDLFMNKDVEFLDYIYQNAEMGVVEIDHIIDRINNADLESLIEDQREEYNNIMDFAKEIYKKYGKDEKEISKMAKISSNITADMMLMQNKENDNIIAKMIIESGNKCIVEITEKLNNNSCEDREILDLAKKLIAIKQHNIDELKKYL